ncbi:hypothetical protein G7Y89_g3262 [Cudoniella acicularis]|uniref:Uracil-DNA glycosylase-like domain-containing protein n=1 Tax=Cudoniella acicularis TaxID=354080 RepID=A0A8H4RT03_9HELO|nr:hypothetical protein G7Y89_g3262 [Cudoniella acicularis]
MENDNVTSSSMVPASFAGKLNIADYAFTPTQDASPRRRPLSNFQSPKGNSKSLKKAFTLISSSPLKRSSSSSSSSALSLDAGSPKKKSRGPSGYASPETYAHLSPLADVCAPNLILIFIGLNPGIATSRSGHAYAHPTNLFWKLLHSSGITNRRLRPNEDRTLPRDWQCGNTNIVDRPTRNGSELSKTEMDRNVEVLEEKIRKWKPEAVCVVGKSIWESIYRVRKGKHLKKEDFVYGWQEGERMGAPDESDDEGWAGAPIFAASSTSGQAASVPKAEKERIWNELGAWVKERRRDRLT